ncbi:MAG: M56 family metallopeptidase, partial [Acidobacteriota bacterium]|nr:M56 family metallopeptidase [Acidobacteriota bacterium]
MTIAHEWFAEASQWWWPRLADHLWQTTVFALVVFGACFLLRRGPARLRHTFWLLASAKFLIPVGLFVFFAQQAGINSSLFSHATQQTEQNAVVVLGFNEPVSSFAFTDEPTITSPRARHNEIYSALTVVWFGGSAAILAVWWIRRRQFMHLLMLGHTNPLGREWQALKRAQQSLRMKRDVGLVILPSKIEPAVWRVWQPIVVLPATIVTHLDDAELEAIMLHELVHIQRHDNLIGNLQLALCALLWFHPVVWFIGRKLLDERELACDERVIEVCGAAGAYGSSILKVVRFCFEWRVAGATGAAGGSNLRRRIENIMTMGNTKRRAGSGVRLLAGVSLG